MKYLFFTLFFFVMPELQAQKFYFKHYTTKDGLIHNRIGTVEEDGLGYIWLGTDDGICRYDGIGFKYYPYQNKSRYFAGSFCKRWHDKVFIVLSNAIAVAYGDQVTFYSAKTVEGNSFIDVLPITDTSFFVTSQKVPLVYITPSGSRQVQFPAFVMKQFIEATYLCRLQNDLVLVGYKKGLVCFPFNQPEKARIIKFFDNQYITHIREKRNGKVVVTTPLQAFELHQDSLFDKALSYRPRSISPAMKRTEEWLTVYHEESNGAEWISSYSNVWLRKPGENEFKVVEKPTSQAGHFWEMAEDREGNMWFASDNGLFKLTNRFFQLIAAGRDIQRDDFKYAVALSNKRLLMANNFTTNLLINNKIQPAFYDLRYPIIKPSGEISFIKAPDNNIWVRKYNIGKIDVYMPEYWLLSETDQKPFIAFRQNEKLAKQVPDFEKTVFNREGYCFTVKENKIYCFQKLGDVPRQIPVQTGNDIRGILVTAANLLWIFTEKNVFVYKVVIPLSNIGEIKVNKMQDYVLKASVFKDGLMHIAEDGNGNIWAGSRNSNGLYKFIVSKKLLITGHEVYRTPAISSNIINCLIKDSLNRIWTGTSLGLDRIDLRVSPVQIEKELYGGELSGKNIYFLTQLESKIYIGTTGSIGMASIHDDDKKQVTPLIHLEEIAVNGRPDSALMHSAKADFSWKERNISFTFIGISFKNETAIKYKYMLEGADTGYTSPAISRTVNYANLSPGNYKFIAYAQNAKGVWSDIPASFTFSIAVPFYRSAWFIALCVVLTGLGFYGLYRYRYAQLLKMHHMRQRISADLHDEIGSTLSSITLMSAVAKKKSRTAPEDAANLAGRIEDNSRLILQNMNDIIWSIKPGNDNMAQLIDRIREFMTERLEPAEIISNLSVSEALLQKKVSPELKRDIYLICREIINNVAKYAEAKNFSLEMEVANRNLRLMAADNGKGFDPQKVKKGNGLLNIEKRVHKYKGKAQLITTEDGTTWQIDLPFV